MGTPAREAAGAGDFAGIRASGHALKEWAAIIKGLEAGEQILLLRKGGIHEKGFDVKAPRFFLFPTYLHQAADKLRPEAAGKFRESSAEGPGTETVRISAVAEAVGSVPVTDPAKLPVLAGFTLMTAAELANRYAWNPGEALHAVLVRVHRLAAPLALPVKPAYGGCRSWIKLQEVPEFSVGAPVLADREFGALRAKIEAALT
jgi:hypothetical protein